MADRQPSLDAGPPLVRRGSARRSAICATSASSRPSPPCRASASPARARGASCTSSTATGRRPTPIRAGSITTCWSRSTRARGSTSASRRCGRATSTASASTDGERVLQIGTGSGYFTAILAELAGTDGPRRRHRDRRTARGERAQRNLEAWPTARVRMGDASQPIDGQWDVIVAFAGATTPHGWWLDALADGGRLLLPMTAELPTRRLHAAARPSRGRLCRALGRLGRLLSLRRRAQPRRRDGARPGACRSRRTAGAFAACAAIRTTSRRDRAGCTATAGASPSASCTDGAAAQTLRLPVVRRGHEQVERPLRVLRRVEHHRRGSSARARPGRRRHGACAARAALLEFAGLRGIDAAAAALPERHHRVRPRLRRRPGGGLGAADRRRSRHRQVDAAAAGGGGSCRASTPPAPTSPGEEALDQVRLRAERLGLGDAPVQLTAATSVRDIVATLERPDAPKVAVIDSIQTMWLDTVDSTPGTVTPGARLGAGAGRTRQAARHRRAAGRPRHQGRRHRRPARARAHGRHGALFRGRARPSVPHPAHGEEPLRPDRRDRRVRDVRPRPVATSPIRRRCSWQSGAATSRAPASSPASRARGRCWSRSRRWSAPPRSPRRGARWSAGIPTGSPWCWRFSKRAAASAIGANDVYLERRRWPPDRRAGRGPRRRRRRRLLACRRAGAGRHGRVRRDRAGRRGQTGRPARGTPARGRQARLPQCAGAAWSRGHRCRATRPRRASPLTKSSIWRTLWRVFSQPIGR